MKINYTAKSGNKVIREYLNKKGWYYKETCSPISDMTEPYEIWAQVARSGRFCFGETLCYTTNWSSCRLIKGNILSILEEIDKL